VKRKKGRRCGTRLLCVKTLLNLLMELLMKTGDGIIQLENNDMPCY
jgi:hypothetical protein